MAAARAGGSGGGSSGSIGISDDSDSCCDSTYLDVNTNFRIFSACFCCFALPNKNKRLQKDLAIVSKHEATEF
jgi:hypothetical protein